MKQFFGLSNHFGFETAATLRKNGSRIERYEKGHVKYTVFALESRTYRVYDCDSDSKKVAAVGEKVAA